jgi:hypothetical protein
LELARLLRSAVSRDIIFLSGATVLPPPGSSKSANLIEDFDSRGRISLLFFAAYFVGWIVVAIIFWRAKMEALVVVNLAMATLATAAYFVQQSRVRSLLHGLLLVLTVFGLISVWATPSLQW